MALSAEQESSLISGGDNFDHWHSSDRVVSHDDYLLMVQGESFVQAVSGTTIIKPGIDYVLVDTTAGNATVTIPSALGRGSVTVVKTTAPNSLTIQAAAGLIAGASSVITYVQWTALELKALNGNWVIV